MSHYDPIALSPSFSSSAMMGHHSTVQCQSLASSVSGNSIINSTYIAAGSLDIDGLNNTIPFCRVFASVAYPHNNSVVYEVWLPDASQHNGRYLSVGENIYIL